MNGARPFEALGREDCLRLLRGAHRGRLVATAEALPAVEPVPYAVEGDTVVVRTREFPEATNGSVVSLSVDHVDDALGTGWSVLVTGTARLIAPTDKLAVRLAHSAPRDWRYGVGSLLVLAHPMIRGFTLPAPTEDNGVPAMTTPVTEPDEPTLRAAVALAVRAPSIHNSQPWRWRLDRSGLDLYADRSRLLPAVDPDGHDLLISCGAALQHARVAFAAAGWQVAVHRLPDPTDRDHLARLDVVGRIRPAPADLRLAAAAVARRTDRRPFDPRPVPEDVLAALRMAAENEQAYLQIVTRPEDRLELTVAIGHADSVQRGDAGYRAELAEWTGRGRSARDGVPASAVPHDHGLRRSEVALRDFELSAPGELNLPAAGDEHPVLALLTTDGDDDLARLRAGEAVSALLLTATDVGLAVSPLTQPLEVPGTKLMLRRLVGGVGFAQMVLRIGWPVQGSSGLVATPRRDVDEVIEDMGGGSRE